MRLTHRVWTEGAGSGSSGPTATGPVDNANGGTVVLTTLGQTIGESPSCYSGRR